MSEDWSWAPDQGRWRRNIHGRPASPTRLRLSTAAVPEDIAYDYWRDIAYVDFEADPVSPAERRTFKARADCLVHERLDFFKVESDAVSGRRDRRHVLADGMDGLTVGLVIEGERRARQADGADLVTGPGGLYVYDATLTSTVQWDRHKSVSIGLRRPAVQAVLGLDLPEPANLARALEASSMRYALRDQLTMIARQAPLISPDEQAFLTEQASGLALYCLSSWRENAGVPGSVLLQLALRHIEEHFDEPDLDASGIARALQCSRATLYRAFAAQDMAVAECLRDYRLDQARLLLEQTPPGMPVATIAMMCGVYDAATFSRQFRRRFGTPPSQVRRRGT